MTADIVWGVPLAVAVAALVVLALSHASATLVALAVVLLGVAATVALWNVFRRLSFQSQDDRAREQRARDSFSRRGRWPHQSK